MCQVGKGPMYCVATAFQVVCTIPSNTRKRCILADEKAVSDCKRTRRTDYHEPHVVGRRTSLYRYGPYLEGVVLEKCDHIKRDGTYIAAEERPKTSCKRDYALRDTICKANNWWWCH
jgi:hypothetical protein